MSGTSFEVSKPSKGEIAKEVAGLRSAIDILDSAISDICQEARNDIEKPYRTVRYHAYLVLSGAKTSLKQSLSFYLFMGALQNSRIDV